MVSENKIGWPVMKKTVTFFAIYFTALVLTACNSQPVIDSDNANHSNTDYYASIEMLRVETENEKESLDATIDFTTHSLVCAHRPAFQLRLQGQYSNEDRTGAAIDKIIITDLNGILTQEIVDLQLELAWPLDLRVQDFNFDGYTDFALKSANTGSDAGANGHKPYYFWSWNSDIGQFVFSESLSKLSRDHAIELELSEWSQGLFAVKDLYPYGRSRITIEYIDGDFVAVREWRWQMEEAGQNSDISRITTYTDRSFLSDFLRISHSIRVEDVNATDGFAFAFVQNISGVDGMDHPLHFSFTGRKFRLERDLSPGDFTTHWLSIEIADAEGDFIQLFEDVEIEILPISVDSTDATISVSFMDVNFDGYLDMIIHKHRGGNRWAGPEHYWLWDSEAERFVYSAELSTLSGGGNVDINPITQQVMTWWSSVEGRHYTFYEWDNDILIPVSTLQWTHFFAMTGDPDFVPPEGYSVRLVRRDLISGEEEVWHENWED